MMLFARLPFPRWAVAVTVVVLVCGLVGFRYWFRERPLATLEQTAGNVARDYQAKLGQWETARRGASFVFGDGVKTGSASKATLALFDASTLTLEPQSTVRFLDRPSARSRTARLDVLMGSATLEADEAAVELDLALGIARLEPHTRLRLARDEAGLKLEVMIGSARFLGANESLELQVGNAIEIKPDRTVQKLASAESQAAVPAVAGSSAGAMEGAAPEASSAVGPSEEPVGHDDSRAKLSAAAPPRGPDNIDFTAAPGQSFVIHDAVPPTAVGFTTTECPHGAARLTVASSRGAARETFGSGRVSASVPAGSYRYTLECADSNGDKSGPVLRGTLSVLADAGTRQLAKTAPSTSIDTDGRRYTVLYQSLLPKVSVAWPNAPEASSYTLTVNTSGRSRTFTSPRANYAFTAGVLGEGDHSLSFEGAGRQSRRTELSIRFDNAAPTASISSPSDGSFAPGASVLVAGAALPGWTVSVAGKTLEQDAQQRFSEQITAPAGQRAVVIRFSHPTRGVHYYLKRSAGR